MTNHPAMTTNPSRVKAVACMTKRLEEERKLAKAFASSVLSACESDATDRLAMALDRGSFNPRQSAAYIRLLGDYIKALKMGSTTTAHLIEHCRDRICRRVGGSMTASDEAELQVWAWIVNDIDLGVYAKEDRS